MYFETDNKGELLFYLFWRIYLQCNGLMPVLRNGFFVHRTRRSSNPAPLRATGGGSNLVFDGIKKEASKDALRYLLPWFISSHHYILNSPSTAANQLRTVEGARFFGGFDIAPPDQSPFAKACALGASHIAPPALEFNSRTRRHKKRSI